MSAVAERTRVTINVHAGCDYPGCSELAHRIHKQLSVPNYSRGASLMPVPDTLEEWRAEHRTARKRADRAARLGYVFGPLDRSQHNDDIHAINTSLEQRQGRPMTDGYRQRHNHGKLPEYPCDRHCIRSFGITLDTTLVAYLTLYRVGDLAMVSMILGHGQHLRNDIMYLLFQGVVIDQQGQGGTLFYNRHDSGTAGLVYYKERVGFTAGDIDWQLA